MMFKKTEAKYEPDPRLERALDVLFILHADHEQNCSTNAVRGVGSSQVDPYSAVAAGVAALYGPLHGGANEAVLRMLRRIETVENVPDFLEGVKKREERLMGFGHRVYKNYDPRARIIEQHMDEVFEATEYNPLVEIARELEKRALDDDFFTSRKLYPNVDYYSGIIYEALQIPTEMFTVIFAIPRTSGWVSQWMEMNDDPEQKIARPRQIYIGERERDYVAIDEREGPEKIIGPPARRPKRQRRGAGNSAAQGRARLAAGIGLHDQAMARTASRAGGLRRSLDEAHRGRSMARRPGQIRREGPLEEVNVLRDYGPGDRVHARLELSTGGLIRGREAGIDVMGDGTLVPYTGVVRKRRLEPRDGETRVRRGARGARGDGEAEVPKGSVAVGRRVRLPRGAEPPIVVYVNGVEQAEGADYELRRGEIVFSRPIVKEQVGGMRWLAMLLGLFGTYRKHETVDVEYRLGGQVKLASDVEILPDWGSACLTGGRAPDKLPRNQGAKGETIMQVDRRRRRRVFGHCAGRLSAGRRAGRLRGERRHRRHRPDRRRGHDLGSGPATLCVHQSPGTPPEFMPVDDGSTASRNDAFDGAFAIWVGGLNGKIFGDADGNGCKRGQRLSVGPTNTKGFKVSQTETALQTSPTLRMVFQFKNTTGHTVKRKAIVETNLGSDADTTIEASSSGNQSWSRSDRWLVTHEEPFTATSDPVVSQVWFGKQAAKRPVAIEHSDGNSRTAS